MKVEKCSDAQVKLVGLSYDEILKEEGVYKPTNNEPWRTVVFKLGNEAVGLFYSPELSNLEPCCVKFYRFIKTAERVCFEIRA